MIKITFLKKDETARKIYQTIWNNRNTWYLPYLRLAGGHFHGLHTRMQKLSRGRALTSLSRC